MFEEAEFSVKSLLCRVFRYPCRPSLFLQFRCVCPAFCNDVTENTWQVWKDMGSCSWHWWGVWFGGVPKDRVPQAREAVGLVVFPKAVCRRRVRLLVRWCSSITRRREEVFWFGGVPQGLYGDNRRKDGGTRDTMEITIQLKRTEYPRGDVILAARQGVVVMPAWLLSLKGGHSAA